MRKKLGEIFKMTSGGTPKTDVTEYYANGSIPWVKTGDLKIKDLFSTDQCITELGLKNSSAKLFPENTVLIAMYGATIGACSILRISACSNQACAAFLPNETVVPEYFYYFLKSIQPELISKGVGGGQPNISGTILKGIEFDLIDISAQQKIANMLSEADKARQLRKQANALTDQFLQSTFLSMFGDPVSNPKGWGICKVIDVCGCIVPGRDKPKSFSGNVPWVTTEDLDNGYKTFKSKKDMALSKDEIAEVRAKLIPKNSVIMTCVGDLGIVTIANNEMVINQQLHSFQCSDQINNFCLVYILKFMRPVSSWF